MPIGLLKRLFNGGGKARRILLVHDDQAERRTLSAFLESLKYETTGVFSLDDAAQALARQRYAAMMLPPKVGKRNAVAFLRERGEDREAFTPPAVFLVDAAQARDADRLQEAVPRAAILKKPFSLMGVQKALGALSGGGTRRSSDSRRDTPVPC
jgi:CheY-like chemotaxis protein